MKSLLWGDLSVHSGWAAAWRGIIVAASINQNLVCVVIMLACNLTTQLRRPGFESFFKSQIPAAHPCHFETSDLVLRITREGERNRLQPPSAQKLMANRRC